MRMRFRANLEIGEVPAFWEDRLYGESGTTVRFTVGAVCLEGTNPCQRCVVPTRDPLTGTEAADSRRPSRPGVQRPCRPGPRARASITSTGWP